MIAHNAFSQEAENKIFEASKGKMEIPVIMYNAILKNKIYGSCLTNHFGSRLIIVSDSSYEVNALHSGKVVLVEEIDTLKFLTIVKYGDYYISYYYLENIKVKKGNQINAGQVIGTLARDLDNNYSLEIMLNFKEKELCVRNWIDWNSKKRDIYF